MATTARKLCETVLRVRDADASVRFYTDLLGMTLLSTKTSTNNTLTEYRVAYTRKAHEGVIALQHKSGIDAGLRYHNGNKDPRGFGHTCVAVDNLDLACARLEKLGARFQKKPSDGRQHDIAFVLDPDDYWVELIPNRTIPNDVTETDPATYCFNHTMIRVRDPEVSLAFYRDVLGFSLLRVSEHKEAKFNLYFLAFDNGGNTNAGTGGTVNPQSGREGILELTWNYGTESDSGFKGYSTGNSPDALGFSNITIAVENVADLKKTLLAKKEEGIKIVANKTIDEDSQDGAAYFQDPDGYQVKFIPLSAAA